MYLNISSHPLLVTSSAVPSYENQFQQKNFYCYTFAYCNDYFSFAPTMADRKFDRCKRYFQSMSISQNTTNIPARIGAGQRILIYVTQHLPARRALQLINCLCETLLAFIHTKSEDSLTSFKTSISISSFLSDNAVVRKKKNNWDVPELPQMGADLLENNHQHYLQFFRRNGGPIYILFLCHSSLGRERYYEALFPTRLRFPGASYLVIKKLLGLINRR